VVYQCSFVGFYEHALACRGFLEAGAKFFGGLAQKITNFRKFFQKKCNSLTGCLHLVIMVIEWVRRTGMGVAPIPA
jgi:hypothetical protein